MLQVHTFNFLRQVSIIRSNVYYITTNIITLHPVEHISSSKFAYLACLFVYMYVVLQTTQTNFNEIN